MASSAGTITHLLRAWQAGDDAAQDQLFVLLYDELHQIAWQQRKEWRGGSTLNTTALVHELYLKLAQQGAVRAEDRRQFNRFVAKALRHILIDYARAKSRKRRGGGAAKVPLDAFDENVVVVLEDQVESLLMADAALTKLAARNTRLADVVELRYYGGLTHDEIAQSLGISERTARRDWAKAKVLLYQIMHESGARPDHTG